jgi:integrase
MNAQLVCCLHDRSRTDAEIRWLWLATGKVTPAFGNMVRSLLLTGQRRTEVANLAGSELDLKFASRAQEPVSERTRTCTGRCSGQF